MKKQNYQTEMLTRHFGIERDETIKKEEVDVVVDIRSKSQSSLPLEFVVGLGFMRSGLTAKGVVAKKSDRQMQLMLSLKSISSIAVYCKCIE